MSRRVLARIILLFLMSMGLLSCGVKIQGIDLGRVFDAVVKVNDLGGKSEEEEIALGEDIIRTLLASSAIDKHHKLQTYVNKVGYWLVRYTPRNSLPWRFMVLEDSSINAFAAPGGHVAITTGMLASLNNEAELAGVLAHEIAHVVLYHHLNALQKKSQAGIWLDFAVLGTQVGNASTANDKGELKGPDVSGVLDKAIEELYYRGLDREDEYQADRLGVLISAKAGYDPYAFVSVLQVIGSREGRHEKDLERFIRIHPSSGARLQYLEPVLFLVDSFVLSSRVLAQRYRKNTLKVLEGDHSYVKLLRGFEKGEIKSLH